MKRQLIIRPQARLDVDGHYVYLLGRNPDAASRLREAVKAAYKRIRQEPRGCASISPRGFDDLEIRFCHPAGFSSYYVVFQVTPDSVRVLRVLHTSQDLESALRP